MKAPLVCAHLSQRIPGEIYKNNENMEVVEKTRGVAFMVEIEIMTCGHLRPLAPQRPLAATCGHSSGCKWLRVAAGHCEGPHRWARTIGRTRERHGNSQKRPLAATCGHSSGCEWPLSGSVGGRAPVDRQGKQIESRKCKANMES